jgi:uncharacterized protein
MKKLMATIISSALLTSTSLAQTSASAGTGAQKPVAVSPPAAAAIPAPLNAHPALWVVKDADTTIYLFGTIHLLKPEIQWFGGTVKKAYDSSSEIVLELVQPDPAAMQSLIVKLAVDPDGPPLTTKLGAQTTALYEQRAKDLGIPVAALENFEPWFVSIILGVTAIQKAGLNPESGAERVLSEAAKRDTKRVIGLETSEQQLAYFDTLPEPLQIAFLKDTLEQLPQTKVMFDKMVADWGRGDPDALSKLLNESLKSSPEIARILLVERNRRWAAWIDNRLKTPGTVFMAVGAGHLAGTDSVQSFLNARKIKAKRIAS